MSKAKKQLKKNRFKNIFDPADDSFFAHQAIEGAMPSGFTWTYYYIGYYMTPSGHNMTGNKKFYRQKVCNNFKEVKSLLEYLESDPKNSDFSVWSHKIKYDKIKALANNRDARLTVG
jgi:hypothetical protein